MNSTFKTVAVSALVSLVVMVAGLLMVGGNSQPKQEAAGAATPGTRFPHGLTVGLGGSVNSPTNLALYEQGTCTITANASIAATSSALVDCAATDVVASDVVSLTLQASTTLASQYVITSAIASTTAGHIQLRLLNLTGTAATPTATNGFGSSTVFQIWRAQ